MPRGLLTRHFPSTKTPTKPPKSSQLARCGQRAQPGCGYSRRIAAPTPCIYPVSLFGSTTSSGLRSRPQSRLTCRDDRPDARRCSAASRKAATYCHRRRYRSTPVNLPARREPTARPTAVRRCRLRQFVPCRESWPDTCAGRPAPAMRASPAIQEFGRAPAPLSRR